MHRRPIKEKKIRPAFCDSHLLCPTPMLNITDRYLIHISLQESVGKSRRDAMFIESSSPLISESPFMGERRLVALLKELLSLNRASLFYKHFTATRFSRKAPEARCE